MDTSDDKYHLRCIELATKGMGNVAPNPLVGAVIVHDNTIIGEGYHNYFGGPHAEVNAINSVKNKDALKKSKLIVNLEPCSHYGKTPPCVDLIIENGIPEVIIGCVDPNPVVSGKGIDKLKKAGIKVSLTNDSSMIFLNRRFFTFQEKHRPYIILKWAETSDGFIDKIRDYNFELPEWLTDDYARLMVHKWRSEEQAILVGTNTVLYDNPHLTTRYFYGKNPIRMIIDRTLRLPSKLNVFDGSTPTVVFTEVKNVQNKNIKDLVYVNIDFEYLTYQIMEYCYNNNISSLIIEGGTMLIESFIKTNMWDEARIFTSDNLFGRGIVAPSISCQYSKLQKLSNSVLRYYFNHEWHELIKKIRL